MCVKWLVRTIEHANYSQFMSDGHAEGISILYVIFMLGTGHIYYVPVCSDFCNGTRAEIPPPTLRLVVGRTVKCMSLKNFNGSAHTLAHMHSHALEFALHLVKMLLLLLPLHRR